MRYSIHIPMPPYAVEKVPSAVPLAEEWKVKAEYWAAVDEVAYRAQLGHVPAGWELESQHVTRDVHIDSYTYTLHRVYSQQGD